MSHVIFSQSALVLRLATVVCLLAFSPSVPAIAQDVQQEEAGKSITYTCRRVEHKDAPRPYKWDDDKSKVATLNFDGVPIFRSMYEKVDNSSQERRDETYKAYHHVFSPDDIQR